MIFVLTPQQMRDAERRAMQTVGESSLMREAGGRIAEAMAREPLDLTSIVAFAGPGNNGGDAFAVAAELRAANPNMRITVYNAEAETASDARKDAAARAADCGVEIRTFPPSETEIRASLARATCIVDGLFGTGSRLPLAEPYSSAVAAINACGKTVVAIDLPTGIDALTGTASDFCVRADVTIALAALKPGLLLDPARGFVGTLYLGNIGIDRAVLEGQTRSFAALDDQELLSMLPARPADADKRSAGAPLLVAGSAQFPGAAVLCALGAARAGAGYVTVASPASAAPSLRLHLVEQVVTQIPEDATVDDAISDLVEISKRCTAVGIGPGLGLDGRTGEVVRGFLRKIKLPFVADASALFHFAKHLDILNNPGAVITPHAGEFARLSGGGTLEEEDRVERLREFVHRTHCTTLLKGRTTLIDDGNMVHMNTSGTAALATAGTGDVLTGMIATLLSQGLAPVDAARAAAFWHGRAAQMCGARRLRGVVAGDLPNALGEALAQAGTREESKLQLILRRE
ncbi:MAG: hypothetical protein DLM50_06540 [Candidatus Meridianibacter frigidus]|nr:MAG: hypothetical protein DLM50_06540 [Candidatus Eremiobacteraeota bacterium]